MKKAVVAAKGAGHPALVRAAFALSGSGGGLASDEVEPSRHVKVVLANGPQIVAVKSSKSWNEFEDYVQDVPDTLPLVEDKLMLLLCAVNTDFIGLETEPDASVDSSF